MDDLLRAAAAPPTAVPAALLYSSLVLLDRGLWKKLEAGPLDPDMFSRPNAKGLTAALYLLYTRIHGKAKASRELWHCWPLSEPGQQREFRTAMHAWVKALGTEGRLSPDVVRYFPMAYQTAGGPRAVEQLSALCVLALEAEAERAFPGAIDDVAPDPADEDALTGGWAVGQLLTEGRRKREADSLSARLAALQRLQHVWQRAASQVQPAAPAALWSSTLAHTSRVQVLQQVLGAGLPICDQSLTAIADALGRLLLPSGSTDLDCIVEPAGPSLAERAAPEAVLECLRLRLAAAVQRLQECCAEDSGRAVSALEVQAEVANIQLLYKAVADEPRRRLQTSHAAEQQAAAVRPQQRAERLRLLHGLLPPNVPLVDSISTALAEGRTVQQSTRLGKHLDQSPASNCVRQQVWAAVQCVAAVAGLACDDESAERCRQRQQQQGQQDQQERQQDKGADECWTPPGDRLRQLAVPEPVAESTCSSGASTCSPVREQHASSGACSSPTLGDLLHHMEQSTGAPAELLTSILVDDDSLPLFTSPKPKQRPAPSQGRAPRLHQPQWHRPQEAQEQRQPNSPTPAESIASRCGSSGSGTLQVNAGAGGFSSGVVVQAAWHGLSPMMSVAGSTQPGGEEQQHPGQQAEPHIGRSASTRSAAVAVLPQQLQCDPVQPATSKRRLHAGKSLTPHMQQQTPTHLRRALTLDGLTPPHRLGDSPISNAPGSSTPISRQSGHQQQHQQHQQLQRRQRQRRSATPTPQPDSLQRRRAPGSKLRETVLQRAGSLPVQLQEQTPVRPSARRHSSSLLTTDSPQSFETEASQRLRHQRSRAAQEMQAAAELQQQQEQQVQQGSLAATPGVQPDGPSLATGGPLLSVRRHSVQMMQTMHQPGAGAARAAGLFAREQRDFVTPPAVKHSRLEGPRAAGSQVSYTPPHCLDTPGPASWQTHVVKVPAGSEQLDTVTSLNLEMKKLGVR